MKESPILVEVLQDRSSVSHSYLFRVIITKCFGTVLLV